MPIPVKVKKLDPRAKLPAYGSAYAAGAGIKKGHFVVTVVGTTPTPVEMEHAVSVVTVAYKGMASAHRLTSMEDRSAGLQFIVYNFLPFAYGVEI